MKQPFDKYVAYETFVQEPAFEIEFLNRIFRRYYHRKPLSLREDFCGTGFLSTEWVKQSSKHTAVGVDLDLEPIESGRERHFKKLDDHEKKRIRYLNSDVLHVRQQKADLIVALNFSYWFFLERKELLRYFRAVRKSMKKESLFVLDTMGGSDVTEIDSEHRRYRGTTYFWECERYNPITHRGFFSIHFKRKGERLRKRVFTYDWRCWSLPETRDLLEEAGFSNVVIYWDVKDIFVPREKASDDAVWIAYMVAFP